MKKSLAQNAIFNTVYRVLNILFPLISATYVSRALLPEGVGKVTYAQNIISYFLMIATMGIYKHGVRVIAQLRDDQKAVNKAFSELLSINFISTTVCLVVYYLMIHFLFPAETVLLAVCGIELFFNYFNIDWFYQGREEYVYIVIRSIIIKICSLVLIFVFVKDQADYIVYAAISCMAMGCNYFFNVVHARKNVRLVFRNLNLKKHLKPLFVFIAASTVSSIYSKVDITMLGIIANPDAVGYYSTAYKVINLVLTLITSVTAVFFPRLSYAYSANREEFHKLVTSGLKTILLLEIPACFGLMAVADNMVAVLFGDLFSPAAMTLRIMSLVILIRGIGDLLCYQVLICTGNEKHLIKGYAAGAVANIVLNSLLIRYIQHDGAAVATLISELAVNGVLLLYARKVVSISIDFKFVKSIVLGTMGMLVSVSLIQPLIHIEMISLVVSVLLGILTYLIILLLTGNSQMHNMFGIIKSKLHKR